MVLKNAGQMAENSTKQSKNKDTTESENTLELTQNSVKDKANNEYQQFVYIGPSLPNGELKENIVLEGNFSEILQFLDDKLKKYPQIKQLIIPVNRLGEYLQKVQSSGNIINKYYSEINSTMKQSKEE